MRLADGHKTRSFFCIEDLETVAETLSDQKFLKTSSNRIRFDGLRILRSL